MAFEFKLSTDEIREKMFDFIKPVYKETMDSEVDYINWIYGVYDGENGFFITYVNSKSDREKYILLTENGRAFYIVANRCSYTFSEIPGSLMWYGDIIQDGIKLYNREKMKKRFMNSFSDEQKRGLDKIKEKMKDRCRPNVDINNYEDAEKLFCTDNFNYYYISHRYTKNTVANFDKYMSDAKMCTIRGKRYGDIISKIVAYGNTISDEDYEQITKYFREMNYLNTYGTDDICIEKTFEAIKKAFHCRVINYDYIRFIKNYIKTCIKMFPNKIQSLRPFLDFMNEYMIEENFKKLDFYRKELEKLIYKNVEGFQFILTTNELREKMFDFLKLEYRSNITNINWITGVCDKKNGIFLTEIYRVPDGIARCGVDFYGYIVITDNGKVFRVDNDYEYEKRAYNFKISKQYENFAEKIKEGIEFYQYDYEYRSTLNEDIEKELKEIVGLMDDRCRQSFTVNNEKDAQKLFEYVNFDVNTILRKYNKKTINDFNKFATDKRLRVWREDRYLQLLKKVRSFAVTEQERYRSFETACYFICCGINDTYDKEFLETVEYMYNIRIMRRNGEDTLKRYINTYIEDYSDRLKNIVPLVKFLKTRAEDKYLKDTIEKVEKILNK